MRLLPLLVLALALTACAQRIEKVSPHEFQEIIGDEDVFVIDVHTPEQAHIPGTDAVIPYDDLEAHLAELPSRDTPIAVYCRSGHMSAEAVRELREMGYKTIYDLEGGENAWVAAGLPVGDT